MTKGEFLMTLRNRLTGEIPPDVVQRNLTYYEKYISDAEAAGRTEASVLEELGDPLLIAKTIIDTVGTDTDWYREYTCDPYRQNGQQAEQDKHFRFYSVPSWAGWIFLILFLVLVVTLVRVLLPVVVPLMILWMLFSLFRRNRR